MSNYSHNEALFIRLLQSAGEWVGIDEVRRFTKEHCKSECFNVNSRASELRTKYGYNVKNEQDKVNGVTHSKYRIIVTPAQVQALRMWWVTNKCIPHYNQIIIRSTAKQTHMQYG